MAGRIPQMFIDTLLEQIDIVDVIDGRVKLKKSGRNYTARCPFHDEKTPSFSVNQEKQFYYCFGCGASGNAIGFIMNYENIDFPKAIENLANALGLEVPQETKSLRNAKHFESEKSYKPLYECLSQVSKFYQSQLREHPAAHRAVAYLKERGLTGKIAKDFQIGFAPPGWHNLINNLGSSESDKQKLLDTGMIVKNEAGKTYDRFRDRIIFPIRDRQGRVIAFGGRVLGNDKPKYLNSPETSIFHKSSELYGLYEAKLSNRSLTRLLVTEGYLDVIALAQFGIDYSVATLGTSTNQKHLERIFRLCPEIIFCFDGDQAGRNAALKALEATLPTMLDGRQARFLFLPEGEDPDTLIRAKGRDYLESLISSAKPLEEFLFDTLNKDINMETMEGRARFSKIALPYLNRLPAGIFRELMLQELANKTGISRSSLSYNDKHAIRSPQEFEEKSNPVTTITSDKSINQSYEANPSYFINAAIKLLLHRPNLAHQVDQSILNKLENKAAITLRDSIIILKKNSSPTSALLLGHWHGTANEALIKKLANEEQLVPEKGIEVQFHDAIAKILQNYDQSTISSEIATLKSKSYSSITEEEKKRLVKLLQMKQNMEE